MTFRFEKTSLLLPAHLFAFDYFKEWFDISIENDLVVINTWLEDPKLAYQFGQIVACIVKDLQELTRKYQMPVVKDLTSDYTDDSQE